MAPSDAFYGPRRSWQAWAVLFASLLLTALTTMLLARESLHAFESKQRIEHQAQTNLQLKAEIRERVKVEAVRDRTIQNLETALSEVDTLRGILPICSFCKKVRDDTGYWEKVEVYIHKHSQADFSHGICPECLVEHYPDVSTELSRERE